MRGVQAGGWDVGRECDEVLVVRVRRGLGTNQLTGTIPTSLGELSSLQYL